MNWKVLLTLTVGLMLFSSPAWAQGTTSGGSGFQFEQPEARFEIIPMGGYVWTVSQSASITGFGGGDLDIKSDGFWGIALDVNARPGAQLRLLYRRQDSQLTFKQAGVTQTLSDIAVEYWHIGGVGGMRRGNILPFTSLTLGGTRYVFDNGDDWKFSVIIGLGAKVYINEKLGLMFTGQMPFTFTNAFLGIGTGGLSVGGTGIVQFDLAAGLMITI